MTLKEKIEAYIGSYSDTNKLNNWLNSAAKVVVNIIPMDVALKYSAKFSVTESGISRFGKRILGAMLNNIACIEKSLFYLNDVTNTSSLHKATTDFPVYIQDANILRIFPTPNDENGIGLVYCILYPAVDCTTSEVILNDNWENLDTGSTWDGGFTGGIPIDWQEAIVLYTAIQAKIYDLNNILTFNDLFITHTIPTAPVIPVITYEDVVPLSAEYEKAGYNLQIYIKPILDVVSDTLITITDSLPTMDVVVSGVDLTNANDYIAAEEDLEKADKELNKQTIKLEEYKTALTAANQKIESAFAGYKLNLDKAIAQANLTQEKVLKVMEAQITSNLESAKVEIETLLANASKQADIDSINAAKKAEVDLTNAAKAIEVAISNATRKIETIVSEYKLKLESYGQEVALYEAVMSTEAQKANMKVQNMANQTQGVLAQIKQMKEEFGILINQLKENN